MMYNNGFVVCIKDENSKVLREQRGREVYLPFYSNYSILLKNTNNRPSIAKVEIDGTDILGGMQLILPAYGSVELDRFCIDGNLNVGKKLHFVPQNDSRVSDPTSTDNGLLNITFTLEKKKYINIERSRGIIAKDETFNNDSNFDISYTTYKAVDSLDYSFTSISNFDRGATVESSSTSSQSFKYGYIGELEHKTTIITLELKPYKHSITVDKTRHEEKQKKVMKRKRLQEFLDKHPDLVEELRELL